MKDSRAREHRAMNIASHRAAGFRAIDDYAKGEEIKVLCPQDGDYQIFRD